MRFRPARYRNGYHRILTRRQRRHRWLLYFGLALLALSGNRCAASCTRVKSVSRPGVWAVSR
jgi:hypothetical protein